MLGRYQSEGNGVVTAPVVSVVSGSYNRLPFLRLMIESVRTELATVPHEIVVVDGGSTDGSVEWLVAQKDVVTVLQHNRGKWRGRQVERRSWGAFMNMAFRIARAPAICMLSDDCLVVPGAIRNGLARLDAALEKGEKVGAIAFYWRNWPEENVYRVGLAFGRMFVNHGLYLKESLDDVGFAEEAYDFYHSDTDLVLKMWRLGYVCVDSPLSFVEHFGHASPSTRKENVRRQESDWKLFLDRWSGVFCDQICKDVGSWTEKSYDDPDRTASQFRDVAHLVKGPGIVERAFSVVRASASQLRRRFFDR